LWLKRASNIPLPAQHGEGRWRLGGGAFSAALKICLKKRELRSLYHQKHIENGSLIANPQNKKFVKIFCEALMIFQKSILL
jgi:hypothetical protein